MTDLPLTRDPKTIAALACKMAEVGGTVMVTERSFNECQIKDRSRRHLKLRADSPYDVFVKTGKRGQNTKRLIAAKRLIDGEHPLWIFQVGTRT